MKKIAVIMVLVSLIGLALAVAIISSGAYTSQRFTFSGATASEGPVIEIISPERGQEIWIFDHLQTVRWRYRGFTGNYTGLYLDTAAVYLRFPDERTCAIGEAPVIQGKVSFMLKKNRPCGIAENVVPGQYRISVAIGDRNLKEQFVSVNDPSITIYDSLSQISLRPGLE